MNAQASPILVVEGFERAFHVRKASNIFYDTRDSRTRGSAALAQQPDVSERSPGRSGSYPVNFTFTAL